VNAVVPRVYREAGALDGLGSDSGTRTLMKTRTPAAPSTARATVVAVSFSAEVSVTPMTTTFR
jgi:hypothetical protein